MVGAEGPRSRRSRPGHPHRAVAPAAGVLVALAGCTPHAPAPQGEVLDLLQQDWQHVPGVTADGAGLRVTATALSILGPGGTRQPAPPLDLDGTHLVVAGEFTLSARFTDVTGDATWAVYDSPPVVADEFRIEPAGLRLTLDGDDLEVSVFDGAGEQDVTDPRPVYEEHVRVPDPDAVLSVRRSGDALEIASGGDTLSSAPLGGVFDSGELWLGLSSDDGSFTVGSLTATAAEGDSLGTAGPAVAQAEPSAEGLQALAARTRPDLRIGAAVALGPLASDATYAQELIGDFGAITPENAMKAQALSPRRGVYTFEEADALLAVAESRGMAVHGHTIAFSEAMPRWMQELPTGTAAERQDSADALRDYLTTVVRHFRGRLASLDVVNEPFDLDQGTSLQENTWYRVFGPTTRRSSRGPSTTPTPTSSSSSTRTAPTCRVPARTPCSTWSVAPTRWAVTSTASASRPTSTTSRPTPSPPRTSPTPSTPSGRPGSTSASPRTTSPTAGGPTPRPSSTPPC